MVIVEFKKNWCSNLKTQIIALLQNIHMRIIGDDDIDNGNERLEVILSLCLFFMDPHPNYNVLHLTVYFERNKTVYFIVLRISPSNGPLYIYIYIYIFNTNHIMPFQRFVIFFLIIEVVIGNLII